MKAPVFKPAEFDYTLPTERIAQRPVRPRDASRLLVLRGARLQNDTAAGPTDIRHGAFRDLPSLLQPGDLLVLNDTRVIPARLRGRKTATGGRIEILLLENTGEDCWRALARGLGKARPGTKLSFTSMPWAEAPQEELEAELLAQGEDGAVTLAFPGPAGPAIARVGEMPIPHYIRKGRADKSDAEDYQTCFAVAPGAVAAPTASLHFTPRIFSALNERGVQVARLTLHVGWGTFAPLKAANLPSGRLHAEAYHIPEETAEAVNAARREGRRVIAAGTTTTRALETVSDARGHARTGHGTTDLFIRPGYRFRVVDGLLTNFHLPRSSLLALVCAFAGRDRVLAAYREAIETGYRVYSYGDAMLLL